LAADGNALSVGGNRRLYIGKPQWGYAQSVSLCIPIYAGRDMFMRVGPLYAAIVAATTCAKLR